MKFETEARSRPRDPLGRLKESGYLRARTESLVEPAGVEAGSHFDKLETAPRQEIEALQTARLLRQLPYAYARSALVRSLWQKAGVHPEQIRTIEEFKALAPFMDKEALQAYRNEHGDAFSGTLCHPFEDLSVICSSGGTTGDPTLFAERWGVPSIQYQSARDFWQAGLRPGDYVAIVSVTMRPPTQNAYQDMGMIPVLFDHHPREAMRLVQWSREFRPTAIMSFSSILLYGLAQLEKTGVDIREAFSSYKLCIWGGEPMGPQAKAMFARWGLKPQQLTAMGDVGTALENVEFDGHHVWEDQALIEVLDPITQKPVAEGEVGELVVTSLVDRITPYVRFRSGDLVRYTSKPSGRGTTHGRIWVLGRSGDEVVIGERSILPIDVWPAVESVRESAAGMFQIVRPQREMETLRLRVGYDGEPDHEDLKARLADAVEQHTGLRPEIELMLNSEMMKLGPPHKIPRVTKK